MLILVLAAWLGNIYMALNAYIFYGYTPKYFIANSIYQFLGI